MAFAIRDWPNLVRQSYNHTVSGDWCELQDFDLEYRSEDGSMLEASFVVQWIRKLLEACRTFGCEPCPGPKLADWLQKAGFRNIKSQSFRVPIGTWPRDKHDVGYF